MPAPSQTLRQQPATVHTPPLLDFKLHYPSSLSVIYPPLYPHLQIYPTLQVVRQSTPLKSTPVDPMDWWLPDSPASPDRLPSVGLASRLQTPAGEDSYFAFRQQEWLAHQRWLQQAMPVDAERANLIEQALGVPVVPLAVASLPSPPCISGPRAQAPAPMNVQQPHRETDMRLGYPSSLYKIYPTLYPHFDLYPSGSSDVLSSAAVLPEAVERWLDSPASPLRLPSVGLASRMQTPDSEDSYFAYHQKQWLFEQSSGAQPAVAPPALIEQAFDVAMVSLAEASLPSPALDVSPANLPANIGRLIEKMDTRGSYPSSLYSIYPSIYPHLDIYPAGPTYRGSEGTQQESAPVPQLNSSLCYPSSIYNIYPAVYPYFDLYPARVVFSQHTLKMPSKLNVSLHKKTTSESSLGDDEWPVTPPSPDRLLSVGLASRLQTPAGELSFMAFQQDLVLSDCFGNSEEPAIALIDQAFDVPMVSLADASLPSPVPLWSAGLKVAPPDLQVGFQKLL